jgi:hypothetical protein
LAAAYEQGLIENGSQVLVTAEENLFHTPFSDASRTESTSSYIKLQKIEKNARRSLIGGIFPSSTTNDDVIYTDIKLDDHFTTSRR